MIKVDYIELNKINVFWGLNNDFWENYFRSRTPSELTLIVLSETSIQLDWINTGTGFGGHKVEKSIDEGVTFVAIGTVAMGTNTFIDEEFIDGSYYRVRAYKDNHFSSYSNVVFYWNINWTTLTDGLIIYRKGFRGGKYVIDFSSDGGIIWELNLVSLEPDEDTIIINIDGGVAGYRHQIRDNDYCIDHVLDETGFAGIEDENWECIYKIEK